jgi:hypothetical protein
MSWLSDSRIAKARGNSCALMSASPWEKDFSITINCSSCEGWSVGTRRSSLRALEASSKACSALARLMNAELAPSTVVAADAASAALG